MRRSRSHSVGSANPSASATSCVPATPRGGYTSSPRRTRRTATSSFAPRRGPQRGRIRRPTSMRSQDVLASRSTSPRPMPHHDGFGPARLSGPIGEPIYPCSLCEGDRKSEGRAIPAVRPRDAPMTGGGCTSSRGHEHGGPSDPLGGRASLLDLLSTLNEIFAARLEPEFHPEPR